MEFSKVTGNEVRLTATEVMKTFNVGRTRAHMAISGLEERGWIQLANTIIPKIITRRQ